MLGSPHVGSLILIGSLANVLVINIAYGVSVRRIALRLLLLALFLAAVDLRRLANWLLLHRPAAPVHVDPPLLANPLARRTALAVKTIVIASVVASRAMAFYHERTLVTVARPALYGVFSVQRMVRDGRQVASEDSRSWNWIAIDGRSAAIGSSNGRWERRRAEFDDALHTITLWSGRQAKNSLTYSRDGDNVIMAGVLDDQPTEIVLRRVPEPRFALQDATRVR